LLANVYLDPLDHLAESRGWRMTRYADDFIVQCRDRAEAEAVLEALREWMGAAGLTLHPEKTRIVDATQSGGFDFLGWHFERGMKWPRAKSLDRMKEALRDVTPRTSGESMAATVNRLNRRLRAGTSTSRAGCCRCINDWTSGCGCACAASIGIVLAGKAGDEDGTINAIPTTTSRSRG